VLAERIRPIHSHSHETCGRPRFKAELAEQGIAPGGIKSIMFRAIQSSPGRDDGNAIGNVAWTCKET
jgi:hypothetical protein